MDIVINACFGGFRLSDVAMERYCEIKGIAEYAEYEDRIPRNDPALVQVVRELGDAVNGPFARLAIVWIPDDVQWTIEGYDGYEHVAEVHRTWRAGGK